MKRYGQIIELRSENAKEYIKLHANVWPEVLKMIQKCNMRNYSIFMLRDDTLFSYFEYIGDDFEADMEKMSADPKTQEWWGICGPMQIPLSNRSKGEWWHSLKEVFHVD